MSDVLQNLSTALGGTVEAAGSSVVQVNARRRMPASGIVWDADGTIVTANHVVRHDDNIKIGLADGQTVSGSLVGRDPTTDLAVIKAESSGLTPATWAEFNGEVKVGHLVLALGRPGKTVQATLGIVSALGSDWRTPAGGKVEHYLQTDVVMYPGFSGGPLVSATGQVLGLNTSALLRGVSLAVPTPTVQRVVETLQTHGRVRRGYLGVSTQAVRLPADLQTQLNQETGLLLAAVEPDSPAAQGGLLLGDTIVSVDESAVRQHDDLVGLLSADRVGTDVTIKFVRGGQVQETGVTVGERD
ncbi:MAG: trypsin-like peptidase domain-containing protein [Anaerolineae bacterium]|nr:trypsin-like peptidase domain-containing protein [Anaerolineae bacterium]